MCGPDDLSHFGQAVCGEAHGPLYEPRGRAPSASGATVAPMTRCSVRLLALATPSGAGRRRASVALRVELGRCPALLVGVEAVGRRPCGARPVRRGHGGGAFAARREHSQPSARIRRWRVMPRPGAPPGSRRGGRPGGVRLCAAGRPTGLVDGRGIGCTEGPLESAGAGRDLGPRWPLRHARMGIGSWPCAKPTARGTRSPRHCLVALGTRADNAGESIVAEGHGFYRCPARERRGRPLGDGGLGPP